jgi:outer membrane biosynthesis protein TonB
MEEARDKRNKRIAFLISAAIHASLFLTFFLLISWSAPYPPAPEYGVELNFGLDDQGGGEVQPTVPVGNPNAHENDVDQKSPDNKDETKSVKEVAQPKEEVTKADDKIISDETSDVEIKSKKNKPEEKPKEKVEVKKEKDNPADEVKPVVKKEAVYTGKTGEKKGETNQSQGDDDGKVGDKGNPQGKLDAKALYGNPGGGGGGDGFGLSMSGWAWADKPRVPDIPDNENGSITFEIECDENGDIVNIKTLDRGLSLKAEQLLKTEIQKSSLYRTSNGKAAARSKGQVVFVLRTK